MMTPYPLVRPSAPDVAQFQIAAASGHVESHRRLVVPVEQVLDACGQSPCVAEYDAGVQVGEQITAHGLSSDAGTVAVGDQGQAEHVTAEIAIGGQARALLGTPEQP